jgi:hypothetical protein
MAIVSWRLVPVTEFAARLSQSLAGAAPLSENESDSLIRLDMVRDPLFSASHPIAPLLWRTRPEIVFARLRPETRDELVRVFTEEGVMTQVLTSQEALGCNLAERINNWAVPLIPYLEGIYQPDSEEVRARLHRKSFFIEDITTLIVEEKRLGSPVADSFWRHLQAGDHRTVRRLPEIRAMETLFLSRTNPE